MAKVTPAAERYRQSLKRSKQLYEKHPWRFKLRQRFIAFTGFLPNRAGMILITLCSGMFSLSMALAIYNKLLPSMLISLGVVLVSITIFSVVSFILRHRRVRINYDLGIDILRQDAPDLFKVIKETRRGLKSPKIHKVQIGSGMMASIDILPAFGPFGPTRRRLLLGIPMLASISPDQAMAVIAHELAHSLSSVPHTPPWINWTVRHWRSVLNGPRNYPDESPQVRYFIRLASMCDACSQLTERFADKKAASLYGKNHIIDALLRISLMDAYSSDIYWPRLRRMQGHRALPPDTVYSTFTSELIAGNADENAAAKVGYQLLNGTLEDDSHPSLLDRLRALGWEQANKIDPTSSEQPDITPPPKPEVNAWEAWFVPASRVRLTAILDRFYQEANMQIWQAEHHRTQSAQDALKQDRELINQLGGDVATVPVEQIPTDESGVLSAPLSADPMNLTRTANLLGYAAPSDIAKPLLMGLLNITPDLPHAHLHLGQLLLDEKDPACLEHLEKACELSPALAGQARQKAFMYLRSVGRIEEAEKMRLEADIAIQAYQEFHIKLTSLSKNPSLAVHGLTQLDLVRLTRRLASYPIIKTAYLFKRADLTCGDLTGHALFVELKTKWYKFQSDVHMQRAEASFGSVIDIYQPFAVWVLNREGLKPLRLKIRKRKEAIIYQA